MLVPILFTQKDSNYNLIPDVDCYDVDRNALTYKGTHSIVVHPPCRLWSRLRYFSSAPKSERLLAVWAVTRVRALGGVLEHPAGSSLFSFMNIPLDGSCDIHGGYVISVNQSWFGFPAQKKTYLYVCGLPKYLLPSLPLCFDAVEYSVSNSRYKKEVPKSMRSLTTPKMCEYLILIARYCQEYKDFLSA